MRRIGVNLYRPGNRHRCNRLRVRLPGCNHDRLCYIVITVGFDRYLITSGPVAVCVRGNPLELPVDINPGIRYIAANHHRTAVLELQIDRRYFSLFHRYGRCLGRIAFLRHGKRMGTDEYVFKDIRRLAQHPAIDRNRRPDRLRVDIDRAITGNRRLQDYLLVFTRFYLHRPFRGIMRHFPGLDCVHARIETAAPLSRTFRLFIDENFGLVGYGYRYFGKIRCQSYSFCLYRTVARNNNFLS